MPSDNSIGRADSLCRQGWIRKGSIGTVATAIDAAIQEACKPLVEAVYAYANSVGKDDVNALEGTRLFMTMLAEARKLKEQR